MFAASNYGCNTRNARFKFNTDLHGFYFEQPDPQRYIQCTAGGVCYEMPCGPLVYKTVTHNCG